MSRYFRLYAVMFGTAVVAASLGGCAVNRATNIEVGEALERYRDRAPADAAAFSATDRHAALSPSTEVTHAESQSTEGAPASLRDSILIALRDNPSIKAAEETALAKAARVSQVTAPPNPMLMTKTLPEPVRTAEGDNYFILGIQQQLVLPQKLERAGQIAFQEARMALESLQHSRLNVIADVKRTYFRLYVIDRTVEADRTNQDLLRGLIDVARARVAAGQRRQDDVLRAQVELSSLESQLIELRQERETLVALFNRLLNRPPQTPVPVLPEYNPDTVDLRLENLLEPAFAQNPELRRLKEQLERDRLAVELAKLAYWPDVTLGFEWMYIKPRDAFVPPPDPQTGRVGAVNRLSEDGSDNWAVTVALNLPLWLGKIEGAIREARHELLASQHEYAAAKNRVSYEIEDALARVRAQQELAELFRGTIIPQAQQAYEVSRASYAGGDSDFLYVIDNWRKWLTYTIHYHRALGELERSVADLEQTLGLSLSEAGGGS